MNRNLALTLPLTFLLSYACGKADDDTASPQDPPEGLGGGDGDFVVMPEGGAPGDGDGDGDEVDLPPPYEHCTLNGMETVGDPEVGLVFDDFDDGDQAISGNGMTGVWYHYGDGTSSQTPSYLEPEGWLPEAGGLTDGGYAMHAVGGGYTTWGSGQGATPAWDVERQTNCLYDASAFDGVSFWIRGSIVDETGVVTDADSGVLKFGVAEPDIVPVEEGGDCTGDSGQCWDWHKTRITLDECWHRYSFRFDELTQDGWGAPDPELNMDEMINFNFEIAQGHSFDFWVDEVVFFVGETPEEEEICDLGMGGAGGAGGNGN